MESLLVQNVGMLKQTPFDKYMPNDVMKEQAVHKGYQMERPK